MSMTFEELKEAYPNPTASQDARLARMNRYCVGGAFCAGQGIKDWFPNAYDLKRYLMEFNPSLNSTKAFGYAVDITMRNDARAYEGAWDALEQAMNYKPEGEA